MQDFHMSDHDEEIEILKVVFPQECELLGEDRIKHLVEQPEGKEIEIAGGRDVSIKSVYTIVKAGLGVIREIQTAWRDTFPTEGKTKLTYDLKNSKIIAETDNKALQEELMRQFPAMVEAVTRQKQTRRSAK
jgi:hypothetical protein